MRCDTIPLSAVKDNIFSYVTTPDARGSMKMTARIN